MKKWRSGIVLSLLALLVTACGGNTPSPTATPAPSSPAAPAQSLTVGLGAFVLTLDPHIDSSATAFPIYTALYDTLVRPDNSGKLQPWLAESWRSVDPTTWEFKLRKDVVFHNGEPFNAAAVKFTIDKVLDPKGKSAWTGRINRIKEVKVVDEYTVQFLTATPFASLPANLTVISMLPPKYIQDKGLDTFLNAPVGTGPFQFVDWKKDSYIKLKAFDKYWGGKPVLADLTFQYRQEPSARMAGLESGELDFVFDVPADQADGLKGKGFTVQSVNLGSNLLFNIRTYADGPTKDVRVREALNLAVDKDAIIKNLYNGYGRVLEGQFVGPDAFGYNPQLKAFPYDPKRAKDLLAQAGFANGFSLKLQGTNGRYPKDKELTQAVAQYLADIGVKADIEILESNVFIKEFFGGTIGPVAIFSWQYMPAMDAELPLIYNTSDQKVGFIHSSDFDNFMHQQSTAFDPAQRGQLLQQALAAQSKEIPAIYLIQPGLIFAYKADVKGAQLRTDYTFADRLTKVSRGK